MRHLWLGTFFIALLAISACSEGAPDFAEDDTESAFHNPYFSVTVSGVGPDIILVPGLASSGAVWDGTVTALKDRFTLHVIQVNGFAGAPAAGNAGNENVLVDLAAGLSLYANQLDDPPTLIGHSLGGLVAMQTALQTDAELRRLVIVDVLPFFSVLMDPAASAESIAPISAFMKATLLSQSDDVFEQRQAEALGALVKSEDDLRKALTWSIESDRAVMAQAMSEVLVTDLRSDVAKITVPTIILYAKDDDIPNMDVVERYYQDLYAPLPEHNLIAIEAALHFIMLDQPEAFVSTLKTVLDD
ncbi:MAG: alpha/beta hydrolase [Pseudomonadota bacterium]